MDETLETAILNGHIGMLYRSINNDPNMLERIEKVPFIDTPLHIAASNGKIIFANVLMSLKPSFARKLNPNGYTPLHLALRNKQWNMVGVLLCLEPDLVRVRGREGQTPLHYLAKKGEDHHHQEQKLQLLDKFLLRCPLSIQDRTTQNETALHIAVKDENFGAFDTLLGGLRRASYEGSEIHELEIINLKDGDGNNVLHIATDRNQSQVVEILLENSKIDVNAKNSRGMTALDISLEKISNPIYKEVRDRLLTAGAKRGKSRPHVSSSIHQLRSKVPLTEQLSIILIRSKNNLTNESRNLLVVVATMVATVTYQAALSPPGGVWQDNDNNTARTRNNYSVAHRAGRVTMGTGDFFYLYCCNSITLFAATMVITHLLPKGKISNLLRVLLFLYILDYIVSLVDIWP